MRACRAARTDRQEQRRAAPRRRCGIRAATARPACARRWGVFYDALAGQGDFFQNGMLAPPFTPLVEVNYAATPRSPFANPLAARHRQRHALPAGLIIIGWGDDFKTPIRAALQRRRCSGRSAATSGVEAGYVGSRGQHLPIFMEVNPGVLVPGPDARVGAAAVPGVQPGAADVLGGRVVVRLAAGERAHAAVARRERRSRPTRCGHAIDHVSGLNIGGEPRPVLPVDDRRRGVDRRGAGAREGRRAVRRAPPLRRQLRRRAADASQTRRAFVRARRSAAGS